MHPRQGRCSRQQPFQCRPVSCRALPGARMRTVAHAPLPTDHHVTYWRPLGPEDRAIEQRVAMALRDCQIALVQNDPIGPLVCRDGADTLSQGLRSAAASVTIDPAAERFRAPEAEHIALLVAYSLAVFEKAQFQ